MQRENGCFLDYFKGKGLTIYYFKEVPIIKAPFVCFLF